MSEASFDEEQLSKESDYFALSDRERRYRERLRKSQTKRDVLDHEEGGLSGFRF